MNNAASVCVYAGEELARYGFGEGHPFGPDRFNAFWREFTTRGLHTRVQIQRPVLAERTAIERFHTPDYVAKVIRARLEGRPEPKPFRYRNFGNLATIGRRAAVADFGWLRVSGRLAWVLWGLVHIYFLIGFRNRLAVLLDWLWAYITFQRGARLITGPNS